MRIALVGASRVGVATAKLLIAHKHDVVMIEADRARIDELSEELDCGFIHGDGSKPRILREAGPQETDVLLCLSDNDQDNILASLVGRSLGFLRVATKISDPEFDHICTELGLDETLSTDESVARNLADMVERPGMVTLSNVLRGDAHFFVFTVREEDAGPVDRLDVPSHTAVLFVYRGEKLHLADHGLELKSGDDVVMITLAEHLDELRQRWPPAGRE